MANKSDWSTSKGKVIKSENGEVSVKTTNPVTGKKETFTGKVSKKGFLGIHSDVTDQTKVGDTVEIQVDPDPTLWWHRSRIVKKD